MNADHKELVPVPKLTLSRGFQMRTWNNVISLSQHLYAERVWMAIDFGSSQAGIDSLPYQDLLQRAVNKDGQPSFFDFMDSIPSFSAPDYLILFGQKEDVERVLDYTRCTIDMLVRQWNRVEYPNPEPFDPQKNYKS